MFRLVIVPKEQLLKIGVGIVFIITVVLYFGDHFIFHWHDCTFKFISSKEKIIIHFINGIRDSRDSCHFLEGGTVRVQFPIAVAWIWSCGVFGCNFLWNFEGSSSRRKFRPGFPTRPAKPGKMRVHQENLEISSNFET